MVISSLAEMTSASLWLTRATALPSSSTTRRRAANRNCGLGGGEHRRRLVEDQDLGVAAQALDDLDTLAHAGGQVGDAIVGVDLEAVLLADLADPSTDLRGVEPAGVAEGDVLPHGQRLDEAEVLMDHGDAEARRLDRIDDLDGLAVQSDLRRNRAGSSPISIFISVDLPAPFSPRMPWIRPVPKGEVDAVAGDDPPEPLGDVDELRGGRELLASPPTR